MGRYPESYWEEFNERQRYYEIQRRRQILEEQNRPPHMINNHAWTGSGAVGVAASGYRYPFTQEYDAAQSNKILLLLEDR